MNTAPLFISHEQDAGSCFLFFKERGGGMEFSGESKNTKNCCQLAVFSVKIKSSVKSDSLSVSGFVHKEDLVNTGPSVLTQDEDLSGFSTGTYTVEIWLRDKNNVEYEKKDINIDVQ